jgi:hypothetical protein
VYGYSDDGDDDDDDDDDDRGGPGVSYGTYGPGPYGDDRRSAPAARAALPAPSPALPAPPASVPAAPACTATADGGFTNRNGTLTFTSAELAELREAAYTVSDFDGMIRALAEKAFMFGDDQKGGVVNAMMVSHDDNVRKQKIEQYHLKQRREQNHVEAEHGRTETE